MYLWIYRECILFLYIVIDSFIISFSTYQVIIKIYVQIFFILTSVNTSFVASVYVFFEYA